MSFISVWLLGGAVIFAMSSGLWLVSVVKRNASIIDPVWSLFFLAATCCFFWASPGEPGARQWLLLALVAIWSLRLAVYLSWRNAGKGEDFRYAKWRSEGGPRWWLRSLVTVFSLQAAMAWFISLPLLAVMYHPGPAALTWLDYLGIACFGIGFFFEAVGDWQLTRFKANAANKGNVLDSGLWRYTRHPNYFGEALLWWGFFAFTVAVGAWWTIISPIFMTFLLLKVSGVVLLEKTLAKTKPRYQHYVETTSAFVPMPPRASRAG